MIVFVDKEIGEFISAGVGLSMLFFIIISVYSYFASPAKPVQQENKPIKVLEDNKLSYKLQAK